MFVYVQLDMCRACVSNTAEELELTSIRFWVRQVAPAEVFWRPVRRLVRWLEMIGRCAQEAAPTQCTAVDPIQVDCYIFF